MYSEDLRLGMQGLAGLGPGKGKAEANHNNTDD